ncbi:TetR/AcrR family transcriptional regulator C-terminal ligand-binding domain-containing protein [Streptomyces sp. NPDC008317]|uniref:TetR/AcrR family transcriptional regulator n=1 Tax=Streptomyces sp. NPDC008317 TaxID=3364827 RepID=UPI0036E03B4A
MIDPPSTSAARRGRPRSAAVDGAVIETVLRLIAEGTSLSELSIEGIAREAGVGKATVYRRWPGKEALLIDVLATVDSHPLPELPGTSFRDDLIVAVESIRRRGVAKRESALMRTMLTEAQSSPDLWRCYHDTVIATRREALAQLLRRGMADGDIRPELGRDVELLVDFVTGPMLARSTLRPDAELSPDLTERLVDLLLDGMRPRG